MSLINDALKRASEAQGQAAQRPRGPKGVEDLPVPMTPVATRERPAWLPIAGISLLVVALLGASGFFFSKWWKERQAWQPYAETPEDDGETNAAPRVTSPPVQVAKKTDLVTPPPPKITATNPPPKAATPPTPAPTNPPAPVAVTPKPPPVPAATNPVVVAAPAMTNPPPAAVVPVPVPPPAVTNPPPATPPVVAVTPTNPPPPVVIPPPKTPGDAVTKVASVEFPEIKLQGIIRAKKKVSAVVNGKTLTLGDRLEGAFLLKIDTESVTFEKGSVKREFFLLR